MTVPWLTVALLVPIVGSVVVALMPRRGDATLTKQVALGFSSVRWAMT